MNTVRKNNNIRRKDIQGFLISNAYTLGFSEEDVQKIMKVINKKKTSPEKVKLFYVECIKKLNREQTKRKTFYFRR